MYIASSCGPSFFNGIQVKNFALKNHQWRELEVALYAKLAQQLTSFSFPFFPQLQWSGGRCFSPLATAKSMGLHYLKGLRGKLFYTSLQGCLFRAQEVTWKGAWIPFTVHSDLKIIVNSAYTICSVGQSCSAVPFKNLSSPGIGKQPFYSYMRLTEFVPSSVPYAKGTVNFCYIATLFTLQSRP